MEELKWFHQQFLKHLKELLGLIKDKDVTDLDCTLIEQGRTDEEKEVIRQICEDVDAEHELLEDLMQSGMDADEWLEQKIDQEAAEFFPEATEDQINQVKDDINAEIEEEIGKEAELLKKESELILLNDKGDGSDDQQGKEAQNDNEQ